MWVITSLLSLSAASRFARQFAAYSRFFKRLLSILISFVLFFVIPCVRRILLRSFVLIVISVTSSIPNDSCSWISLKRVNKNKTHLILKFLALTFCDGLTLTGELKWG